MPDAPIETESQRLKASASDAHAAAENALRDYASHVQRARSFYDEAEAKGSLPPSEIEKARAAIDEAEREVQATVKETLASIDAQTDEAISRLTRDGD